jgi:excisionase family DNA binding protein
MRYYSTQDVAALLGCSAGTVRTEVKAGRLPCSRTVNRSGGRAYRFFTAEDVRQYLEVYDPARLPNVPREVA